MSLKSRVYKRLNGDGRWLEAAAVKDRLIREARKQGLSKDEAAEYAYRTIDEMFPPPDRTTPDEAKSTVDDAAMQPATCDSLDAADLVDNQMQPGQQPKESQGDNQQPRWKGNLAEGQGDNHKATREQPREGQGDAGFFDGQQPAAASTGESRGRGESTVAGLSEIPSEWPQLPPNASLGAEVAWVLANRIRVIREDSDGAVVDLSKALTPAPSYAALGWLETSIRAFAKFVDVSARASAAGQDDAEKVRREKLEIAEIRELLSQMRSAQP